MRDGSWLGCIRCIPWSPLATFNLKPSAYPIQPPLTTLGFIPPCSTFEIASHCSTTLGLLPLSEIRVVDVILCNMSRTSPVLRSWEYVPFHISFSASNQVSRSTAPIYPTIQTHITKAPITIAVLLTCKFDPR